MTGEIDGIKRGRVLIVEDVSDIREMLKLALTLEGYEVEEAADGADALELLRVRPLPSLILLDMLMPGMNGWEFVDRIKMNPGDPKARIPIVAVTATSEKVQRTPGEIQAVIRKPVDLAELYETVGRFAVAR